jgi:hypothetical protein
MMKAFKIKDNAQIPKAFNFQFTLHLPFQEEYVEVPELQHFQGNCEAHADTLHGYSPKNNVVPDHHTKCCWLQISHRRN